MSIDFAETASKLRGLRAAGPTPSARSEVMVGLTSKFEGLQAVAAEVLGAWGDSQSITALQDWLDVLLKRLDSTARTVAVRELVPHATNLAPDWVLDRYFHAARSVRPRENLIAYELLPLVAALPEPAARARLLAAGGDEDRRVRRAALLAIVRAAWVDRAKVVRGFLDDADQEIRRIARLHAAA